MKLRTRKFLAGLLSLGLLLQAASPLSALAADSGSAAPKLTITLQRKNDTTPYVGEIDQDTDEITLNGQSYRVDYQDGTYTLTGTMGTVYGSSIGDHLTISGPSDGVKPNLVMRRGENNEVANAYVNVENVYDFTSDSIAGITEFTCDGDIKITADYYAVDFSFKVNSAHDVTVISENTTGQFVVGSANITCTGKVTLRNEGQGALTHGSGIRINGAQDGVELYCKNATRMANGITIENCKGDISIINENGPIGDPSLENALTVGGKKDTDVTIKANTSGPVTNGKISVTSETLTMQNDGGSIGNLTFTRTDTASNYRILTGKNADSITSQTAMTGGTYSETVNAKYLNIQPGTPENTNPGEGVTNYGIKVTIGNGTPIEVTSKNCENILGVGNDKLAYSPGSHTLTGTGSFDEMKVEITSNDLKDKVDVVLSNNANGTVVNGSLTVTGAKDVKVTGETSTALITRDATITCAGDILMDNTGSGNVLGDDYHGNLDVKSAQKVTIHGVGRTSTDEDGNNYTIYGKAEINCSGDVEITS